jgi:hypothetical protein
VSNEGILSFIKKMIERSETTTLGNLGILVQFRHFSLGVVLQAMPDNP